MVHELKASPENMWDVIQGKKTFEVRENDGFNVGDTIMLKEYLDGRYMGKIIERKVVYILDDPRFLKDNCIVLGIAPKSSL